jgi:outer membrane protein insertion porin family
MIRFLSAVAWLAVGRPARASGCLAAAAMLAWAGLVAPAAAQDDLVEQYVGRPVSEIRIVLSGAEISEQRLRSLLDVRVGSALSMAAVRESIVHIMGLGHFQDVRVDASTTPDGVRLVFEVVALRTITRVVFRGDLGLPEATLGAAVIERYGPAPAIGRAADVSTALEQILRDHGFLRARVTLVADADLPSGSGDLAFDIAAGPAARIEKLILDGPQADLLGSLPQRLQVRQGDRYDPAALQARIALFLDEWHRGGYYQARLDRAVRVNDTRDGVTLTLTLDRGPVVTVEFQGDSLLPRERAELVPVSREGTVDQDLLEDSERSISDYLRTQGYRDAQAPFTQTELDGKLRIVFTVRRGPLYKVSAVKLPSVASLSQAELRALMKVAPGQVFVQARLDADVASIVSEYHRRGYVGAKVTHKETIRDTPGRGANERLLDTVLEIVEGPRTLFGEVRVRGNAALETTFIESVLQTRPGLPFNAGTIESDRERLLAEYLDRGYRMARVDTEIVLSDDRTRANVHYTIQEGPEIIVDHILIVGNQRINESTIRHEVTLQPGQPLGLAKINESQQRLAALGLFRRVTISELQHRGETRRDVIVTVEESPSTTIGYGGGLELQTVETTELAPRAFFELGRRNLWGKNRSLNFYSRISVRKRSAVATTTGASPTTEYRVVGSYREPRFLQTRDDLQASVLFEQGSRTSFSFRRRSFRLELSRRFGNVYTVSGQYALERNDLLAENLNQIDKPLIDRLFPSVRLSTFSFTAVRDTRDDQLDPGSGFLIGVNGNLALVPLGSQIGFAKTFLQAFTYRKLPLRRRVVVAAGARLGLGTGFPRTVPSPTTDGAPVTGGPAFVTVRDLPANERFFAGGDTTVRGFQLDHLGTAATFDRDGQPIGGHGMVVFNAEMRMDVWRDVGVVGFLDAGNVFATGADLGRGKLRAGAGFGIRYKSPVGPLRLDVGFKLGTLLTFASTRESRTALHISIGQAF